MIIDLKKYLFVGAKEDIAQFFLKAQSEGCIEFVSSKKKKETPADVKKLLAAIKILRKLPTRDPLPPGEDLNEAAEIATEVIELTYEIEKLLEEKRLLEAEIARVAPFGEFSFEDIAYIEKETAKNVQFYCVKTSKAHEVDESAPLFYVGTDYDLDYYMGIHDKSKSYPQMIEMHFDRTADQLRTHFGFVDETIHQLEAELKGYAGHLEFLRDALLGQLDIHSLAYAKKEVDLQLGGFLFSAEGWVPKNKIQKLPTLIEGAAIFFEEVAIEEGEKVPTYMENSETARIGEDLVNIYDTPASSDKDPSKWVLWAFTLFFAMILADGGYGLLYLGLAFYCKYKFPNMKASGKRFVKLFFILATSCVIWGVVTLSFFGIEFNPTNPLAKYSLFNQLSVKKADFHLMKKDEVHKEWVARFPQLKGAQNGRQFLMGAVTEKDGIKKYDMLDEFSDSILMELSLLIGVIHISLSLLRYARRNFANIGWILFAVGGYLYFPVTLKATSMVEFLGWISKSMAATVGVQLLYGGVGGAIVLALFQRRLKGVGEIIQIISVFADILSYLRLYALALASTIMARTFNQLGAEIGLVVGSVVVIVGHLINLSLGTMSGVIHGLRLNFIEWYHYCFEGEGTLFNPLRKLRTKQE